VIGRFVLSYAEDPMTAIEPALAVLTGPRLLAFEEWQLTDEPPSVPDSFHLRRYHSAVLATLKELGTDVAMGLRLPYLLGKRRSCEVLRVESRSPIIWSADPRFGTFLEAMTEGLLVAADGRATSHDELRAAYDYLITDGVWQLDGLVMLNQVVGTVARLVA
jgi:hypothetical protein